MNTVTILHFTMPRETVGDILLPFSCTVMYVSCQNVIKNRKQTEKVIANQNEKALRDANTVRCLCRRGTSSICVPNLKRIALFVQKLLWGSKISKLCHVTQATPI